jgi:hypothetical protein
VGLLLRNISLRASAAEEIILHTDADVSVVEAGLLSWLRATSTVVSIRLPHRYQTAKVVAALENMLGLKSIATSWRYDQALHPDGASHPFPNAAPPSLETTREVWVL